jgi:hypothetical protein
MRRVLVVAAAALLTATLAVGAVAGASSPSKPMIPAIGIYTAELNPLTDYRENRLGDNSVLSIFVETGSSNTACLATFNEQWWEVEPLANVGPLYCAARSPEIDGVVLHGVYLHVFYDGNVGAPKAADNPNYLHLLMDVYQEGARYYKPPVFCGPNCGE